ncbi:hypothetical protein NIES4103_27950 [Nostoc sp. NIES-4103]|nr:hypothetical protein NIES4103_27950 [Nostoc sp. NIES-4103]
MTFTLEFLTLTSKAINKTFWVNGEQMIYVGQFTVFPVFIKTADGSRYSIAPDDIKTTIISTEAPKV